MCACVYIHAYIKHAHAFQKWLYNMKPGPALLRAHTELRFGLHFSASEHNMLTLEQALGSLGIEF